MTTEELSRLADDGCPQVQPLPKIPWLEEHCLQCYHKYAKHPWQYSNGTVAATEKMVIWTSIVGDYPPADPTLGGYLEKMLAERETLGFLSMERLREWAGMREDPQVKPCDNCMGSGKQTCRCCGYEDAACEHCGGEGTLTDFPKLRPGRVIFRDYTGWLGDRQLVAEIPEVITGEFAIELHKPIFDTKDRWHMLVLRRPDLVIVLAGLSEQHDTPGLPMFFVE